MFFSRVAISSRQVENVEVRKRKYGSDKGGSLVPRLFLCGWGALPIQETSGKCPLSVSRGQGCFWPRETMSVSSRGGSAGIRDLYSCVTSSGDIRYYNRSYAVVAQRKNRVSCVFTNGLSFKICVFQVVKSPHSHRDRCYCYCRHVRTL